MFASCGTVAALAEIWTITTMAYERCRIICSPYIKKRLSAAQVSLIYLLKICNGQVEYSGLQNYIIK